MQTAVSLSVKNTRNDFPIAFLDKVEFLCVAYSPVFSLTLLDSFHPHVASWTLNEFVGYIAPIRITFGGSPPKKHNIYIVPCSCYWSAI